MATKQEMLSYLDKQRELQERRWARFDARNGKPTKETVNGRRRLLKVHDFIRAIIKALPEVEAKG